MTILVSSFSKVRMGDDDFTLILTKEQNPTPDDPKTDLQWSLERAFPKLGNEVGNIWAVRSRKEASETAFGELQAKRWPDGVRSMMLHTDAAFMLVIDIDFREFDPAVHDWRILWFSGIKSPRDSVGLLMDAMKASFKRRTSVFDFFDQITKNGPRTVYGSVSSPHMPISDISRRSRGQPRIFEKLPKASEYLNEIFKTGDYPLEEHGSAAQMADKLRQRLPSIRKYSRRGLIRAIKQTLSEP